MLQSTPEGPFPTELLLAVALLAVPMGASFAVGWVGEGVRPLALRIGRPVPIGEGRGSFGDTRPVLGSARPGGSSGRWLEAFVGRMEESGGVASRIRGIYREVDCTVNSFRGY